MTKYPRFLARSNDYAIFELDESNNCYRPYIPKGMPYSDGIRPQAHSSFTFENVTDCGGFFPIDEEDVPIYEKKNMDYIVWRSCLDGHGGSKGGSRKKFRKRKREGRL